MAELVQLEQRIVQILNSKWVVSKPPLTSSAGCWIAQKS